MDDECEDVAIRQAIVEIGVIVATVNDAVGGCYFVGVEIRRHAVLHLIEIGDAVEYRILEVLGVLQFS